MNAKSHNANPHDFVLRNANYTTRQTGRDHVASILNKENKLQSLLAAVEMNRTAVMDQRRSTQVNSKDHYQSHREFGRDISNNANHSQGVSAKIVNSNGGQNVSLFKNFIAQYQSQYSQSKPNPAHIPSVSGLVGNLSKLDLNSVSILNPTILSQRGCQNKSLGPDDGKAGTSHTKTFDLGTKGSQANNLLGAHSIREMKVEPLRRKFANNLVNQSNTRRIGDDLRRLGMQVSELPKVKEEEGKSKSLSQSIIVAPKQGVILSRALAAQQMIQQKSLNTGARLSNKSMNKNYNSSHTNGSFVAYSVQSSQLHTKTKFNKSILLADDKENKPRVNIQSSVQLKRSKTSDPLRAPLRQKDPSTQSQQTATIQSSDKRDSTPADKISEETLKEVAKIMEDRRKEEMKTLTRNLEVCDLLDMRNPQAVAEFAPQIYKNLHLEEKNFLYPADFMQNQIEVSEKMRAYLIDWLGELHLKFKLQPETLYVCTSVIDHFLQAEPNFKKKELQCLGITALHIAGKYEEIYPPDLKHILKITDNAVVKEDILKLEFKMLLKLDFNLTFPSIFRFMERYARIAQVSEQTSMLAQYLCDSCLLDCTLMKEKPSKLAAIALYAALRVTKGSSATIWNATLSKNTGYKEDEVKGMGVDLIQFVKNVEQSSLQSLVKKYSSEKYLSVASLLQ